LQREAFFLKEAIDRFILPRDRALDSAHPKMTNLPDPPKADSYRRCTKN
jgi:hypothetical protein